MSDAIDIEKLRALDAETVGRVFSELAPLVRASVRRFRPFALVDEDDVLSEVYLQLLRNPDRLAELAASGRLNGFCSILARNTMIHMRRREQKDADAAEQYEKELAMLPIEEPPPALDKQDVEKALASLSEIQRQVILMDLQGQSLTGIASSLGITSGQARVHRHRAFKVLRRALAKQEGEPGR